MWQVLSSSRPSYKLGTWENMRRRASTCPFCGLVVDCVRAVTSSTNGRLPHDRDVIELSNRASWKMCILLFNFNSISSKLYSNRADLEYEARWIQMKRGGKEAQRLLISWPGCETVGQIQRLAGPDSNVESRGVRDETFLGRAVQPDGPDWSLLRSWLRHCDRCHGKLCEAADAVSAHRSLPATMRVIDVAEKSVVPYREGWEYVALTYVWGEPLMGRPMPKMDKKRAGTSLSTAQGAALPDWLPKSVSDAMVAVHRLGYRYLWVDSLCIIQDDDEDRHGQILRMDAIYRNASLSIAAASGGHADYGLPGLSVPRKFRQKQAKVQGLELAVPLPRFDELNAGGQLKWNTRAWTFQEKVLSRRLLIFTDHQIYFRCSNGVWSEDTASETTRLVRPDGTKFFRWGDDRQPHDYSALGAYSLVDFLNFGSRRLTGVDTRASFANYAAVVKEYTQRTLTFHQDALPAIEGVLRDLDSRPSAYVAGLPRWYFPEAVLWHPKLGSTCVEVPGTGAPTWSWARWALPDGCTWQMRDIRDTERLYNRPMFYWTPGAGPLHIAFHEPETNRTPRTPRRVRRCLKESGAVLGLGVRLGHLIVGDGLCPTGSDADLLDSTVSAFKLHLLEPNEYERGDVVGEIVTTRGAQTDSRNFVFVEISQGKELRFSSGFIPGHLRPATTREVWVPAKTMTDSEGNVTATEEAHYEMQTTVHPANTWSVANVMMIERVDGLSYRRGIGKVILSAWAKMSTRRKFVYLA